MASWPCTSLALCNRSAPPSQDRLPHPSPSGVARSKRHCQITHPCFSERTTFPRQVVPSQSQWSSSIYALNLDLPKQPNLAKSIPVQEKITLLFILLSDVCLRPPLPQFQCCLLDGKAQVPKNKHSFLQWPNQRRSNIEIGGAGGNKEK